MNKPLPLRQGSGRPVGARGRRGKDNVSTRRDPSAFEHVLLQNEAVQKPDAVSNMNEQSRGRFKGQQTLSNSQPLEQTPPCQIRCTVRSTTSYTARKRVQYHTEYSASSCPDRAVMLATIAEVNAVEGADVITTRSSFFTVACSNYCKQTNKKVPQKESDFLLTLCFVPIFYRVIAT